MAAGTDPVPPPSSVTALRPESGIFQTARRLLPVLAALAVWGGTSTPARLAAVEPPPQAGKSELLVFSKPDGESFFALGLSVETERASDVPREVMIFIDTSASQARAAREKGIEVLKQVLSNLRPRDLVSLVAIDIDPIPLIEGFVGPQSPEMAAGLEKLQARAPLGATDLPAGLEMAAGRFIVRPAAPRVMLYIGDGMSAANLVPAAEVKRLSQQLVQAKTAFIAMAVGPRLDTLLLGGLANHTGGVVAVDFSDVEAKKYGQFLGAAIRADVFWPKDGRLPGNVVEFFPEKFPPLRTDREAIVIGRGKFDKPSKWELELESFEGAARKIFWTVEPKPSDDVNAYLVELVHSARKAKGWGLPLAGASGLVEARLSLSAELKTFVLLARQAVAMNQLEQAEQLTRRILEIDAHLPEGKQLLNAVKQQWYEQAQAAVAQKKTEFATQALLKALAVDPDYADAKKLLVELGGAPAKDKEKAPEPKNEKKEPAKAK